MPKKSKEFTDEMVRELLEKYYAPMVIEHMKYMVEEDKRTMCKFRKLLNENKEHFSERTKKN